MKRSILISLSIIIGLYSFSQTPVNRSSAAVTAVDARGKESLTFAIPTPNDTTLNGGLDSVGSILYARNYSAFFIRDTFPGGKKWTRVLKSGDAGTGVITFNTRSGTVTLLSADVTTALGYVPIPPNGTNLQYKGGDGSNITFPTIPAQFNPIAGYGMLITGSYPNKTFTSDTSVLFPAVRATIPAGGGITSLNGLTGATQTFGTGTAGTDFGISSSGTTHTFNFPIVSPSNTGKVTPTLFNLWNAKWGLTGNAGTIDGTSFIGTTDNIPLTLRVNNQPSARITSSGNQTYFGYQAGNGANSQFTTAIGFQALQNNIGNYSTAIGYQALQNNTSGVHNVGIGYKALQANTTGQNNAAIGDNALGSNTTGQSNMAIGSSAFNNLTTAQFGVALGWDAGASVTTGDSTVAIGSESGFNVTTGRLNTFLGTHTGWGIITGSYNTIIGSNVTGLAAALNNNIIIADGAGNKRLTIDSFGTSLLTSTTALGLPSGNTAQRPSSPGAGYTRFNTDSTAQETFNGAIWVKAGSSTGGGGSGTVTSVGATTGTSGTDFTISGSPITGTGSFTFNLPIASGTNTGKLSNTDWTTFNNKQATITLTTTGSSGSATLIGSTLNIPQYSGGGGTVTSRADSLFQSTTFIRKDSVRQGLVRSVPPLLRQTPIHASIYPSSVVAIPGKPGYLVMSLNVFGGTSGDGAFNEIYVTHSTDNGHTWSDTIKCFATPPPVGDASSSLAYTTDGRLHILFDRLPTSTTMTKDTASSADNGFTWTTPAAVVNVGKYYSTAGGRLLQLHNGEWLQVFGQSTTPGDLGSQTGNYIGRVLRINATWTTFTVQSTVISGFAYGGGELDSLVAEPTATQYKDHDSTVNFWFRSRNGFMGVATSTDNGATFGVSHNSGLAMANANFNVIYESRSDQLLVTNNPITGGNSRQIINLWVSPDKGGSWFLKHQLDSSIYNLASGAFLVTDNELFVGVAQFTAAVDSASVQSINIPLHYLATINPTQPINNLVINASKGTTDYIDLFNKDADPLRNFFKMQLGDGTDSLFGIDITQKSQNPVYNAWTHIIDLPSGIVDGTGVWKYYAKTAGGNYIGSIIAQYFSGTTERWSLTQDGRMRLGNSASDPASSPLSGQMIFNTSTNSPHYYNGTSWIDLGSAGGNLNATVAAGGSFTTSRSSDLGGNIWRVNNGSFRVGGVFGIENSTDTTLWTQLSGKLEIHSFSGATDNNIQFDAQGLSQVGKTPIFSIQDLTGGGITSMTQSGFGLTFVTTGNATQDAFRFSEPLQIGGAPFASDLWMSAPTGAFTFGGNKADLFYIQRTGGTGNIMNVYSNHVSGLETFTIDNNGSIGIHNGAPSAILHLSAGSATASTAPLKFTSGTPTTTPEAGAMQYNSGLWIIDSSASKRDTIATRSWARANISGGGSSTPDTLHLINKGVGIPLTWTNGADSANIKTILADNGLTGSTNTDSTLHVVLGGSLNQATTLTLGSNDLIFTGTSTGLFKINGSKIGNSASGYTVLVKNPDSSIAQVPISTLLTDGLVTSGTYTPTLTNGTNVASSVAQPCHWWRVGNEISVTGILTATATLTATNTIIDISLPVATGMAATTDLSGVMTSSAIAGLSGGIEGNLSSDIARLTYTAVGTGSDKLFFHLTYTFQAP